MKRIVKVPEGVEASVEKRLVTVKGPKGTLERDFSDPRFNKSVSIEKSDSDLVFESDEDRRKIKAILGTFSSHVQNMIIGVTKGYKYVIEVAYVHFPMNVSVDGNRLVIKNFLGEKGERSLEFEDDVEVSVNKDEIIVTGLDKEKVGQTSANIEQMCNVGKRDRRVFQDGMFIIKKGVNEDE